MIPASNESNVEENRVASPRTDIRAVEEVERMASYEQAFNRIRAEFVEMPGMRLTPQQVERLSGLSSAVCRLVLEDLVRAKFLCIGTTGEYARSTDLTRVHAPSPSAES
jgi:hypothetical protein